MRKSIKLAYGEIKKFFSPECEKQESKSNQILKVYVLNSNLEIHLSYIHLLAVLETKLHYWERNKTATTKNPHNLSLPLREQSENWLLHETVCILRNWEIKQTSIEWNVNLLICHHAPHGGEIWLWKANCLLLGAFWIGEECFPCGCF